MNERKNSARFFGVIFFLTVVVSSMTIGAVGYSLFLNMMCGG